MANINIKSYNEVLGDMIRKVIADTPTNDINKGSVLLTILEAAAANDYENNTAILNVLELLNIDALKNADLDAFGSNLGLTRNTATKASGSVTITDSTITKRSTSLYPIKPAPIAGTSVVHVNDASTWDATGTLYLGRGTTNFEGPLSYTSIVDNGTFFTINLSSALVKDHLLSESVIDGQGTTDRQILAGSVIKIPANNITPEVEYTTLRDSVIAAGEDTSDSISVVAIKAGTLSNAGINTITLFNTLPFTGAEVTNTNAFTNGLDTESDEDFRDRIKAYSSTLARGTKRSILSAIDGASDETDGKQVASAVITEPAEIGDTSIVYIDDGSGFEPSFAGQSVDLLVAEASSNEEFLQLANYPLPRPQIVNTAESPFVFTNGMELKLLVDGVEESVVFVDADFKSTSSATLSEIVIAINDSAETFRCRFSNNSTELLIYPADERAETIQIVSDGTALDANAQLKFPVNEFSYISLFQNSTRLREVERSASLTSTPFATWGIVGPGNLIISVDDTPDQDRSFTISDFGGTNFNALVLNDWVVAINAKYAGLTASATTTGRLVITSNREGSASSLEVVGGSYLSQMFSGQDLSSTGQDSDFALNRQNGNMQIKTDIAVGDVISAGSSDTKGAVTSGSASGGTFNVSADANSRPAEMIVVTDGARVLPRNINLAVGATITLTDEGSNVMRIMASTASAFNTVQPNDYIYITNRGHVAGTGAEAWVDVASSGLFKIIAKGEHLTDDVDTYLEVENVNMVVGGPYSVSDGLDVQAFFSDKYPQRWRGIDATNPAAATIEDIVISLNDGLEGVTASIFRTNFVKMTSVTEEDGSISIPVSVGNATQLFDTGQGHQLGTQSHIANRVSEKDHFTIFERTAPVNANIWLDRYTYTDVKGSITSDEEPNKDGSGTYSETLTDTVVDFTTDATYDDSINVTSGQNKKQTRDIRSIIDADNVGTRHDTPRSVLDYVIGDEYQVVKNLELSSEDNLVAIIDDDAVAKTIDITFSRTGQINGGSQAGVFIPTNLAFSADDADNEPGIDFGTLNVWGTLATQSSTNFNDYSVWFKARNYYNSNGAALIIRSQEFGPNGDNVKFRIEHPTIANATSALTHTNSPVQTLVTYTFGSGAEVVTNVAAADQFTLTDLGSNNFRITFPGTATVANASIGEVISIGATSGWSAANQGAFRINGIAGGLGGTIDIYNESGVATIVGNPVVQTVNTTTATPAGVNGTAFVLTDAAGDTVKFWYDTDNSGTIEPDIGTTTRSHEISTVITGDSDIDIATKTAAAIIGDAGFTTATNGGGTLTLITITNAANGPAAIGVDSTTPSGFAYASVTLGVADTYEILNIASELKIYPITDTATATIVSAINDSDILEAVEQTAGTFIRATREVISAADVLAFGHSAAGNDFISLYDSKSHVITFQNANPNFQLKTALDLVGASAVYDMDTTTNPDGSVGEYFKLVPITLTNVKHHMTHRALSQLDIVSDVAKSNCHKKVQIKSELLGSEGAIEIVGGRANTADFSIIGDSQVSASGGDNYLEVKIPSSPNALSPGQHVKLENAAGVERLNRQISTDTMDVVKINDTTYEYRYNNKSTTTFNSVTQFTIADANGIDAISYPTPGLVWRWTHNEAPTDLLEVREGNLVHAFGTLTGWDNTNQSFESGDDKIAGYPIVKVDAASNYFDVVNPNGVAMASTAIGASSTVLISSTPVIEWRLDHSARIPISAVTIVTNVATATTTGPHKLNVGDTFAGTDIPTAVAPDTGIVLSVVGGNQFTYASTNGDITVAPAGFLLKTGESRTKYKIESLGYNNLHRLSKVAGDSPLFTSLGVAVDDMMTISGTTFAAINNGSFRILAVDEDAIIYENENAVEELDTLVPFNNFDTSVSWVANASQITGVAGTFINLNIGDWVKKTTDDDTFYVQVTAFNTGVAATATIVTLANGYAGITSTTVGHALDQNSSIDTGIFLQDTRDIRIFEGDSVEISDTIFITENTNANWFEVTNSGTFTIDAWGTDATDGRIFLRVDNGAGIAEVNVDQGIASTKFAITEADTNKFTTIKKIAHVAIDEFDNTKRVVYLTPGNRAYKWGQTNVTSISALGKIGYSEDITTGIDGYLYYTGLLRKVQRIIDGFEPDPTNFPGRKAVGSLIEVLPPLKRRVTVALDVTTQDGVNLSEISDEITSVIINYVSDLGVGEDVILSDIVVRVKNIDGVAAVTFITPDPSEERVAISSDEKAFIENSDISIA
jgi:uncharacterized phage protein gp47/JayE